ncbi:MAG: hypothetical protein VCB14_03960 [Alphaproteobacteria bacterium]
MINRAESIIAVLKGARRVWAVSAVHGEIDHLKAIHNQLERHFVAGDRLVYLGNYLGHGARITETVDELLLIRRAMLARFNLFDGDIVYLRGRQEEIWQKLLQLHLAQDPSQVLEWMLDQGADATLAAYGGDPAKGRMWCREGARSLARWTGELREAVRQRAGHSELFAALRRAAITDDGGLLLVHAGIDAARPLWAQTDSFWWGSSGYTTLEPTYEGFRRVIRGFDPDRSGSSLEKYAVTLDKGCGAGGSLHAACFGVGGEIVCEING